jgi:hypothetical protein
MNYASAQELYDHLAQTIDDPEWIIKAVRVKFPGYKQPPKAYARKNDSKTAVIRSPRKDNPDPKVAYSKPMSRQEGWYNSDFTDQLNKRALSDGSAKLLKALHREHPAIMNALKQRGNTVAFPEL